jgi:hypothetical protein
MAQTNIEALQEDFHRRAQYAIERHMVRQLLTTLDPQEQDYHLDYPGLVRRLQAVLAAYLVQLEGTGHGTV